MQHVFASLRPIFLFLLAISFSQNTVAQPVYPSQAIRIIVGFSAGGSIDIAARILAEGLSKNLGQPVVVDNKPGASGMVAGSSVVKAPNDGYTLLMGSNGALTITPHLISQNFDPINDFETVGRLARVDAVLAVSAKSPINTFSEFIETAKQNPGELFFSSSGAGGPTHLGGELLKILAGIDIVHVPYKGDSPATIGLLSGDVDAALVVMPTVRSFVESGQLKLLATMGKERNKEFPDVPTVAEFYPDFSAGAWYTMMAPKNTPQAVVEKLSVAINEVLADPAVAQKMLDASLVPFPSKTPAEAHEFMETQSRTWGDVIKSANITLDN